MLNEDDVKNIGNEIDFNVLFTGSLNNLVTLCYVPASLSDVVSVALVSVVEPVRK